MAHPSNTESEVDVTASDYINRYGVLEMYRTSAESEDQIQTSRQRARTLLVHSCQTGSRPAER